MGRGKNALKFAYLQKALLLIKSELELLNLKIRYPEQFRHSNQQTFVSDLYIIPKSKGLGIIGIAEIVVCLFLSKEIKARDGKPVPLIRIAKVFELAFNLNFGDIYDKQDALFRRKPYNLTKALDYLKSVIQREDREHHKR